MRIYTMSTKTFFAIACCLVIFACSTSPTGRKQLLLFSDQQLAASGEQAFEAMKQKQNVSTNTSITNYVQCISNAIARQVPDSVFSGQWEVVVFDEQQVNAFALPGGKIGVYSGLLEVAQNQHQLAAVIGHEVAHVIAEHANARMSSSSVLSLTQQGLAAILQANEVAYSAEIMGALGLGLQYGVAMPYNRGQESEADIIGLDLMAKAGFNPTEAIDLWHNMEQLGGQRPPEFLSTHPAPQTRINDINENLSSAMNVYQNAPYRPSCR